MANRPTVEQDRAEKPRANLFLQHRYFVLIHRRFLFCPCVASFPRPGALRRAARRPVAPRFLPPRSALLRCSLSKSQRLVTPCSSLLLCFQLVVEQDILLTHASSLPLTLNVFVVVAVVVDIIAITTTTPTTITAISIIITVVAAVEAGAACAGCRCLNSGNQKLRLFSARQANYTNSLCHCPRPYEGSRKVPI